MNNPKTIEAIKVLYRGDIDDAPHQEPLIGDNWFKDVQGARHAVYSLQDGGVRHLKHQAVYDLIRALCLQEPTSEEQKSGVWIDGEFREILVAGKNENGDECCPVCFTRRTFHNPSCQYKHIALCGYPFWLAPPAPVKEPECPDCKGEGVVLRPSNDGKEGQEWPCPKNCQAVKELDSFYWQVVEDRRKQGAH